LLPALMSLRLMPLLASPRQALLHPYLQPLQELLPHLPPLPVQLLSPAPRPLDQYSHLATLPPRQGC
jgi:hypothetical protein